MTGSQRRCRGILRCFIGQFEDLNDIINDTFEKENDEIILLSPDAPLLKVQRRVNICWYRGSKVSCWQAQRADEMPLLRLNRVGFTKSKHCPPIEGIEGARLNCLT